MFRRRACQIAGLCLLAFAAVPMATAADDLIKVVPADALVWGAVNKMDSASAKILKLANLVHAPAVNVLDEAKKESGAEKGLDEKGSVGFFVLPGKTETDFVPILVVAVSDYKEFLGSFEVTKAGEKVTEVKIKGKVNYVAQRGGYALIAESENKSALEGVVGAAKSVAAEMAGMESWLAENDASVAVTAAGIKRFTKLGKDQLKKTEGELGGMGELGPQMAMIKPVFEAYGKVLDVAGKDVSLAVLGVRVDDKGSVRVLGRARLVSGGEIAKSLADIPAPKGNLMAGVPGGSFVFAFGGVAPASLVESYMGMSAGLMKSNPKLYGLTPEQTERLIKISTESVKSVRSMSMTMKTGKRGDPIYSNIYATLEVDNAEQFLEKQLKMTESMNEILKDAKDGFMKPVVITKTEIGGRPALQEEMTFDFSKMETPGMNSSVFDQMFGPGGKSQLYVVAADEHTLVMGWGVTKERVAAAMNLKKQGQQSFAEDPEAKVTVGMLPAGAQWVAFVSPRGYMTLVQRMMMSAMENMGAAAEQLKIPQFPKSPPVGFALKAAGTEVQAEMVVPSAMLEAAGQYVNDLQKMMMDRMQQQQQPPAP